MPGRQDPASCLWMVVPMLLGLAQEAHALVIPAREYQRHHFTEPDAHQAIQASGELSGARWGIAGWVEYVVNIDQKGWYRLSTRGDAPAGVEFAIDPEEDGAVPRERYFHQREYGSGSSTPVGNAWLTAGRHRIRLTRYFWTGFPRISAIDLRPAGEDLSRAFHVYFEQDQRVFRAGGCGRLVAYGGASISGTLEIIDSSQDGSRLYGTHKVFFESGPEPSTRYIALACDGNGMHRLTWKFDGQAAPHDTQPSLSFQVIDTTSRPHDRSVPSAAPLIAIDCATQEPEYASGTTRTRTLADTRYRESGDAGWIAYQRLDATARAQRPGPSWFAYALPGLVPQQRLRVEVDYPDDAPRTFAVAWRDSDPLQYAVSRAIETGREHRLTSARQTLYFHVWPRAIRPRLLFIPAHDTDRAACSAIRVYADDSFSSTRSDSRDQTRRFLNWYEEGENFTSVFGAPATDEKGFDAAVERWLMQADAAGVDTVMPTAVIYNFGMYPSMFNRSFSEPQRDPLRVVMLQAERLGVQVIPELHPRADELAYARGDARDLSNLAISSHGRNNFTGPEGRNVPPHFNALDAGNQQWYLGMIRELADRYRDSPAFRGISLRYMDWANAALDNLVDLDWGYDDATIEKYRKDTGSNLADPGAADADRFRRRHEWLLAHERKAWIQWRCLQVTRLFVRIRDTLRESRPDLTAYLHLFGPAAQNAGEFDSALREAGIDLDALSRIEGLVIVNSSFNYGRLEQDGIFFNASRDPLLDAGAMGAAMHGQARQWIVPTSRYLEAIGDRVVLPRELGFPESTRAVWMSAASEPPGRRALERYAVLLAQTDTLGMGDGGNNHTLAPGPVAEFSREFRKLPALPFEQEAGAVDPVTVRSRSLASRFMFYAVNREDYPVAIRIDLTNGESLRIKLRPYELRVLEAAPDVRISGVRTDVPAPELARISGRIQWTADLLAGKAGASVSGGDASVLDIALAAARRALRESHSWHAHTALETSAVLRVFRNLRCFPPDMRAQFPAESRCSGP